MNRLNQPWGKFVQTRGAVLIMVATAMTALMGFAALAIDLAYLMETKAELQNVSDAAALAGASALGENAPDETTRRNNAKVRGTEYANRNHVLGQPLSLNPATTPNPMEVGV